MRITPLELHADSIQQTSKTKYTVVAIQQIVRGKLNLAVLQM